ncbi:Alpha/Beta hydrolase protein [Leucosporidium creatinivorum]|uniref:Alpha/Beta hydrolase protein n=1 Tax=Leucosporidium creatinivorum TaxID=106004 RepID=A0A1Y2FWP4_9BASI|nr:Alpha/Beta hydrolase protein [Leucosporidium creatinivorum]
MIDISPALTFTYKTQPVELQLDVHLPIQSAEQTEHHTSRRPVLLYFHGGGVCSGNRTFGEFIPSWLFKDALQAGVVCITADYSLLTPATGFDVIADVQDLVAWIRDHLNEELVKLGRESFLVDPSALFVAGSSGGGFVCYMAVSSSRADSARAVLLIYAMGGDFFDKQYLLPKTTSFYHARPLQERSSPYISAILAGPHSVSSGWKWPEVPRRSYYSYLLQFAIFLDALSGEPGLTERVRNLSTEQERRQVLSNSARTLFPSLIVDSDFPPAFFVHGTADSVVNIKESRSFAERLQKLGVDSKSVEVEGGGHGCDSVDSSAEIAGLDEVVPFLLEHLL